MSDKLEFLSKLWQSFHNSIIIGLLFTLLGIGIGVHVSKNFYSAKVEEVIQTGALLYNKKVYTIAPKI